MILLWMMVIANFERALTGWSSSRLLTEWVIFVNAIIATVLVLLLPKEEENFAIREESDFKAVYRRIWVKTLAAMFISSILFFGSIRPDLSVP